MYRPTKVSLTKRRCVLDGERGFLLASQRDPHAQFKALQIRLGRSDLLNEDIAHIGGGLWACPPGVSGPGDWFGKALFVRQ